MRARALDPDGGIGEPNTVIAAAAAVERSFLGHPRGLSVLFATEGFRAFGLYGLESILVLALSGSLLRPDRAGGILGLSVLGHWLGWDAAGAVGISGRAAMLAGLFAALAFMAPMPGGVIADRVLGHGRAVMLGLLAFFVGLGLLAVRPLFLLGLGLALVGYGLSSTTGAQLGALYGTDDPRRSNGFQLYSCATCIAAIFAPVACGTLGERDGWPWGFVAAALGGLGAVAAYGAGRRSLHPAPASASASELVPATGCASTPDPDHPRARLRLGRRDRLLLLGLLLLLPVLALNEIGNLEIYDGYLLWARQHYDLRWGGHVLPVSWLISLDAFISIGATAASVAFWAWLERRGRPVDDLSKITIGTALCAAAVLVLAVAPARRVGLGWGLAFHVLNDVGNTNTYMVSMALYSRLAPPALRATVTNACALQIFLGNLLVAHLASHLDLLGSTRFWLTHAVLIGASAAVMAVLTVLARVMARTGTMRPHTRPIRSSGRAG